MLGLAWKSLGWFLASVAVALGFLLVPLQVAAERKKLDRTVAEIARAHRDIRALETEFEARANLAQLDRWNADTLRLVAPAAGQFVSDERALAAIDVHAPPGDAAAPQMAAFVPGGPAAPVTVGVTAASPAVAAPASPAVPVAPAAPVVRTPSRSAMAAAAPAPAPAPGRRREVALLDRALLDDSMIGDLRSSARAEIGSDRIAAARIGTGR